MQSLTPNKKSANATLITSILWCKDIFVRRFPFRVTFQTLWYSTAKFPNTATMPEKIWILTTRNLITKVQILPGALTTNKKLNESTELEFTRF